jgi:hypothetical protein
MRSTEKVKRTNITTLNIGNVPVTATAAEMNKLSGVTAVAGDLTLLAGMDAAGSKIKKVAKVALAAVDTAGGAFAWQNPEGAGIFINRATIDVTTKATGACTLDIGTTAASATTSSDNLLDGLDVGTATVTTDNLQTPGTNGKQLQKLASGKWVTGSKASGATAGIVGSVYIEYWLA